MGKLLPIILAIVGLGAGIGAGLMLRSDPTEEATDANCTPEGEASDTLSVPDGNIGPEGENHGDAAQEEPNYVKLNNQFVVPVVKSGKVVSLVVMSISLETQSGGNEKVFAREPKLRDAFLRVMFDHANAGGFDGAFTEAGKMNILRQALLETARNILGATVLDVMITDIIRQDN